MDLKKSNGIELRNFYFTTTKEFFENFHQKWSSIQLLPNQVSKKSFYSLKTWTYESPMRSYIKNRVKLCEQIAFKG